MTLALFLVVLQAAVPKPEPEPKAETPLEWNRHLGAALRQGLQKKAQILLVFSSKSCGWCRRLREETFRDAKVRELLGARVLVHVDIDESADVAASLGAHSVPDVRLYSHEGLPIGRQTGYLPAAEFRTWLEAAAVAATLADEPSLKSLRLDSALDVFFDLEALGKPLPADRVEALLALAAGPPGESRTEALRLVRKWGPAAAPSFAKALAHSKLKVRLAAYDVLSEMGAPLGKLDPWAGPAPSMPDLEAWARLRPAEAAVPGAVPGVSWTPALEADLALMEEEREVRNPAARERLVSAGPAIVPRLRERSRTLRGTAPAAAARLDEIRFRILLTPGVLRAVPDAAERLAVGSAGARSRALEEVFKRERAGLEPLLHEALCDPDPLFRETGAASARGLLGAAARKPLADLLKDPESNVRTVALRELAGLPSRGTAESIREYLGSEKDPDMVGHAVRALQEVPSATSLEVLRSLLESPHWSVRGAAVKSLTEMRDVPSLPLIVGLLKDPDGFVLGQAIDALSKMSDGIQARDADRLVEELGRVLDARPQLVRPVLKTLGSQKLRYSKKTDAILRRFTKHEDGGVRAAAVEGLAEDRQRPAFEEVRAALEDPDARVRAAAAAGLRALVETAEAYRLLQESSRPEAYPECRKLLLAGLRDVEPSVRLESALALLYYGDVDEGKAAWAAFLGSPDVALRSKAIDGLRWFGPETALKEVVLQRWGAADAEERDSVLSALRRRERGVETFALLMELLPSVPTGLKRRWSEALLEGTLGDNYHRDEAEFVEARKSFARRLTKAAEGVVNPADQALLTVLAIGLDEPRDPDVLLARLKDAQPLIRRMALAQLLRARVGLPAADLESLARDPVPQVRALALLACIPPRERSNFSDTSHDWLGGDEVLWRRSSSRDSRDSQDRTPVVQLPEPLLNERLADADAEVRLRAAALMTLEGSDEALAYLHRTWRETPRWDTRRLLVRGVIGAWEDAYTPILEEVFETIEDRESYEMRLVFQQITPLKGPRVKAFRARLLRDHPDW